MAGTMTRTASFGRGDLLISTQDGFDNIEMRGGVALIQPGTPRELVTLNAVTTVPQGVFSDGQASVRYLVKSDKGFRKEVDFLLLGPYGPPGGKP